MFPNKNSEIVSYPYPEKGNHPGYVSISLAVVVNGMDSRMEMFLQVANNYSMERQKLYFLFKNG